MMRVRELRLAKGWSQAHLAEQSGVSIRTVQRVEQGAHPGLDSLRRLADVLGVGVDELQTATGSGPTSFVAAVRHAARHFDDFNGCAARAEFWWFMLAVSLAVGAAAQVAPWVAALVGAVALLPWLAVAVRRLRDAGQSPWWLLMLLVPIAGLVVAAILLALPSKMTQPSSIGSGA
jgi:transcriptional regulator with XRE-family HTH domain